MPESEFPIENPTEELPLVTYNRSIITLDTEDQIPCNGDRCIVYIKDTKTIELKNCTK